MLTSIARITATTILISLLFAGKASASDNYFVMSAVALHFENSAERNTMVPGVGWEFSPSNNLGWHAGTFSDSFGSRATYAGINYGTPKARILTRDVRFLIGATVLRKQYHADKELQTKIIPFPVLEVSLTKSTILNISGSPEVDYNGEHSNAVMYFQLKMDIS